MKRIIKNPEPDEFIDWKASFTDFVPGWSEFDTKPIKQVVKNALLEEQGYICCFCETEVDKNKGHIAHLKDQHGHPDKVLCYDNLLYSCPENERGVPQTCGHRQGNSDLPISPLDEDCEEHFVYIASGKIFPREAIDKDADNTIHILNLNAKHLVDSRAKVIREILEERDKRSPDDFQIWFSPKLELSDGHFESFWTAKKYATTITIPLGIDM